MQIIRGILEGKVKYSQELLELMNLCTTCGYCRFKCALNNVDIIEAFRADLVDRGFINKDHNKAKKYILESGNPMNLPRNDKIEWSKGLEFDDTSPVLFYAGCVYSYLYPDILKTIIMTFNKIGIKFNYLKEEENCCGNLLYITGYWDDFENLKNDNLNIIKLKNIKTIITPCPGCARVLSKIFSNEKSGDNEVKVMHIVEFVDKLIQDKKLHFKKDVNLKITWHDPCDLSRHLRIIEEPRRILNSIPKLELIEMEHNKYNSKCCGAGGGMLNACTDITLNIAEKRLKEAERTGAEYIITSCPTCKSVFEKIIRYEDSKMKVMDLFELIQLAL